MSLMLLVLVLVADIIVTVDGRRIEGKIVKETEDTVVIRLPNGELTIPRERIEKVIRTESILDEYSKRAERAETADEHYELGLWCLKNGLKEQAREEFSRALALQPEHRRAEEELRKLSKSPQEGNKSGGKVDGGIESALPESCRKVRSGEFILITDIPPRKVEDFSSLLRRIFPVLRRIYGAFVEGGKPMRVILLSKNSDVRSYIRTKRGHRRMFGGFYIEDEKTVVYKFISENPSEEFLRLIVYQIMTTRINWRRADWLYEGTVRLLKMSTDRDDFDLAITDRSEFDILKERLGTTLPIKYAVESNYSKMKKPPDRGLLGSICEFLLRLFLNHRKEALKRYIRLMRRSEEEHFREVFGSFEAVEKQLKSYVKTLYATSSGRLVYIYRDEKIGKSLEEAKEIPKNFSVWRAGEFLLATDVSSRKATEYGLLLCELLEKMRLTYRGLFRRRRRAPMLTILFSSRDDYRRFVVAEGVKAAENSYGYYSGITHKAYVFESAGQTRAFLLHECTHQIYIERMIAIAGANTSIWFFEGMAEYSEGSAIENGIDWGRPHQTNLWVIKNALKRGRTFKLTAVLSVDRLETLFSGDYESEECKIAYAQVWALFYYLMERHREKFMRYIRSEENGAGGVPRFRSLFGSIRKLEKDWRNFILSLKN